MSKQYNIRWSDNDNAELRKAVKNFNAKISRLEKKNPKEAHLLPERVNMKELKNLISTRQDLKREMNALRRFSKRGAEQIVDLPNNDYNTKATKWQIQEMNRRAGIINRKRKQRLKEIADIEMTDRGERLGYKKGDFGMGKADMNQLRPINAFTPSMNTKDLKKKFDVLMNESQSGYWNKREQQMKDNYIKGLLENYALDDIQEVADAIRDMDFKEFYKVFQAENDRFEYASGPPSKAEYNSFVSALKARWIPNKKAG